MVLSLILNVPLHIADSRRADGECTVSFLPLEIGGDLAMDPFRRIRLQVAKKIVEAMFRFETYKQMDVILDAAERISHKTQNRKCVFLIGTNGGTFTRSLARRAMLRH